MDNNKQLLLDNISSIELTAFDKLAYETIEHKLSESGVTKFHGPSTELAKLREVIIQRLSDGFKDIVRSTDEIEDPELFVRSFCTLDGKTIAKNAVDNYDWNFIIMDHFSDATDEIETQGFPERATEIHQWIQKYLNNKYRGIKILNFDSTDVPIAIEEINQLLDDNGIDRHPELPFTGYSFKEIQAELLCYYESSNRTDYTSGDLYDLTVDTLHDEDGLCMSNQYPESVQGLVKERVRTIAKDAYNAGYAKMSAIVSNPKILDEIAEDDEGYPLLDDYFDYLVSSDGPVWKYLENYLKSTDLSSLADEMRPILIKDLSDQSYDDYRVSEEDATQAINSEYPGARIFEITEDQLSDMHLDYGKHEKNDK